MVTAAIICAVAGAALLVIALAWLGGSDETGWRERTADTAADFRDWLRYGR